MSSMGRTPFGRAGQEAPKPKSLWKTTLRLLSYMKRSRVLLSLALAAAAAGTLMQVLTPAMLGSATTLIFGGVQAGIGVDFAALSRILLTVSALYGGVFVTSFLQERIMTVVSHKTTFALRDALREKMNRVPLSYLDARGNGNILSVAVNDIDNLVNNLQQGMTQLMTSVILFVGILAMMLSISPLLTLLALIMLPGSVLVMKLFTPHTQKNNKEYFTGMGAMSSRLEDTYQGIEIIKSFGQEEAVGRQFESVNETLYQSGWRTKFFGGSMMPSMLLVQNAVYVLIAAVGGVQVVSGRIAIGNLQAFLQYSTQFSSPLAKCSQIWGNVLSAVVSAERIFAVLDAPEEAQERAPDAGAPVPAGKVVFDNVRFGYTEQMLMKGFSLSVQEGEMIAVVGHTGAGKSTLMNLMERFYEIQDGQILIDGTDIRALPRQTLRAKMGMVQQDPWLFAGTIYDNIAYGNPQAAKEEVMQAAKAAFAHDFIVKLPQGYDTVLSGEGGNLSQGQRQLLTIARAFLADPEILILDEATASVDSRTERTLQQAMRRLLKGRTSFVVAHRLSTIYDADRIVVMQQGGIAEAGTHAQLLAKGGVYATIYNSQFAGQAA